MGSLALVLALSLSADTPWLEWGGPGRDFNVPDAALASSWPREGPPRLWSRDLGDGYSAVLADGARLYTLFRRGEQNVAIALDAATGRTLWEQAFDAAPLPNMFLEYGAGPNATPLVVGERVFVVTFTGRLAALDRATGRVLWRQELWKDHGGTFRDVGYSGSPIAYGDTLIVPVGGRGKAVVAFRQGDGAVAWKRQDFENAMSSPRLIRVDGQEQLVLLMVDHVVGLDPRNGDLLWSHEHKTDFAVNVATPVWADGNVLVVSSAYGTGARGLKLQRQGGKTSVTELWSNPKLRVHHGNMIQIGEYVFGSSGDFGPAPLTAVHVPTGKVAWQDRHFPKANFIRAGSKVIVLDEDGRLALATFTPQGITVHSEAQILTRLSWTVPTLVGSRLYVRDRQTIAAFDLNAP
jgi:outer membrane protein assembly factor BamB